MTEFSMKKIYITENAGQTKKLGKLLAKNLLKSNPGNKALVIGLKGDLGGGKTTFLQGLAKGFKIKERVLSPTFIILRKFKIPASAKTPAGKQNSGFKAFYHLDCYRIKNQKEILDLDFKKIIMNPENIIAIEWVERVEKLIPKDSLIIIFDFVGKNKRKIIFKNDR